MKKFFTLLTVALAASAVNAQVKYSWESPEGTPIENGGVIAWVNGSADDAGRLNMANDIYYTICLNGKKANINDTEGSNNASHMEITLNQAIAAGDKVVMTAYYNKGEVKEVSAYMLFDNGAEFTTGATDFPDIKTGAQPLTMTYDIPEAAAGATLIKMTRDRAQTNLFITKFQIVGPEGAGEEPGGEEPGDEPEVEPQGTPETFVAVNYDGEAYVASELFTNAVVENGASTVNFSTTNMDVTAVGGTTAKDVYQEVGTDFAGWTEWNDVKWDVKNQGDIQFGYILGTGNPAVAFDAEEVLTEDQRTGHYRPVYTYYEADGSKGMPLMGLYYKFEPKVDGQLKINVWSNKGNRNTFVVDEDTAKPVKYKAEGYINAQTEGTGEFDENGNEIQRKKWLSAEEIQYLHDMAKCEKDADGNIVPGTDSAPWVIGAGNQPFWGTITISLTAGKKYWLFQHSSQIGFQSYTFTPNEASSIDQVAAEQGNVIYNLRGERVNGMVRGQIYLQNGQKVLFR